MRTRNEAARWLRGTACAVVAVALFAALCSPASAGQSKDGKGALGHVLKKTLLLFPFDVASASTTNASEVSGLLTDVASSRLIASNTYSVTAYYVAWPPVVRLKNDQQLNDADVVAPFAEDNRKAMKIGKLVSYDVVCIGSVDDYQYNETDRQVTMTVSGRLIEVETGKVLKSVTLTGSSEKGGAKAKEEELNMSCARSAGEKLMGQLAPVGPVVVQGSPSQPPVKTGKKRGGADWLWGLLAVGLGLGIGLSGGGKGGGSGIENPPNPP